MKLKLGLFIFAAALVTAIFALTTMMTQPGPESQMGADPTVTPELSTRNNTVAAVPTPAPMRDEVMLPTSVTSTVQPAQPPPAAPAGAEPVIASLPDAVRIIAELQRVGPETPGIPIRQEQADKFKQNLAALVRQGAASVPAIRDFLARNIDFDFGEFNGGDLLGYSSLRASLFDALKQIGGPDAQAAMVQALKTTAVPAEILELAKNLEGQAPGQYSDEIVNAAREAVEMSAANQLGSNVEVGPAFRILQNYGAFHPGALDDQKGSGPKDGQ
jgi:hypothetical protein